MSVSSLCPSIQVQTGPAGRAVAQPMEERQSSAVYFAMAIWFAERELRGFAHFYKGEARDEQEHAATFADYLIAHGQTVVLHDLAAPRQTWNSPEEVLAASFQMEADVTSSLHQIYSMADRSSDVRSTTFLDPIVDAQVTSENRFAHLLGRVRFAQNQPAALLIIDGELSEGRHEPAKLA